jgi:hypothetical protein
MGLRQTQPPPGGGVLRETPARYDNSSVSSRKSISRSPNLVLEGMPQRTLPAGRQSHGENYCRPMQEQEIQLAHLKLDTLVQSSTRPVDSVLQKS